MKLKFLAKEEAESPFIGSEPTWNISVGPVWRALRQWRSTKPLEHSMSVIGITRMKFFIPEN